MGLNELKNWENYPQVPCGTCGDHLIPKLFECTKKSFPLSLWFLPLLLRVHHQQWVHQHQQKKIFRSGNFLQIFHHHQQCVFHQQCVLQINFASQNSMLCFFFFIIDTIIVSVDEIRSSNLLDDSDRRNQPEAR